MYKRGPNCLIPCLFKHQWSSEFKQNSPGSHTIVCPSLYQPLFVFLSHALSLHFCIYIFLSILYTGISCFLFIFIFRLLIDMGKTLVLSIVYEIPLAGESRGPRSNTQKWRLLKGLTHFEINSPGGGLVGQALVSTRIANGQRNLFNLSSPSGIANMSGVPCDSRIPHVNWSKG